jgi:hypothetical protein
LTVVPSLLLCKTVAATPFPPSVSMAAKSILNELYQRLRTASPRYATVSDGAGGFVCTLTLPSVECDLQPLSADRTFCGAGSSKKARAFKALI